MIVVTDTSVILNLCPIEEEELLIKLFKVVVSPKMVKFEFERLAKFEQRFRGLRFPDFIKVENAPEIHLKLSKNRKILHGEAEAITLAIKCQADALLIDERAGHSAASRLGLQCIGILGDLIQAKSQGFIKSVAPLIERLEADAGFWISGNLREKVLRVAGEE